MQLRSGKSEAVPYSLSRWTDVPAAKWAWFKASLADGEMLAFNPRDVIPSRWSLRPEDTHALVFWTKDPSNLIRDRRLFLGHRVHVHVTVTGWAEVEKGAPNLIEGTVLLQRTAMAFGAEHVSWRFSPVPALPDDDVLDRFKRIAAVAAPAGVREAYVSFLQANDLFPEPRDKPSRIALLGKLAAVAAEFGVSVRLCNDDKMLTGVDTAPNLSPGVCVPPEHFDGAPTTEPCGCVIMADPFTINESCTFGCTYCYAADREVSSRKKNTTRLPVLR